MVAIRFYLILFSLVIIGHHLSLVFAVIDGNHVGYSPLLPLSGLIGALDNNELANVNDNTSPYCTATLISPSYVITHIRCCNNENMEQSIKFGSWHPYQHGHLFPAGNFKTIQGTDPDVGVCIIRLRYPNKQFGLRLPSGNSIDPYQKQHLWYAGYGTRDYDNPFIMRFLNTGPAVPVVDIDKCAKSPRYMTLKAGIKNEICTRVQDNSSSVMTLYDNGGPLVHLQSRTILGVGVTFYKGYINHIPRKYDIQLFINLLPLRSRILKAMEDLDVEDRDFLPNSR